MSKGFRFRTIKAGLDKLDKHTKAGLWLASEAGAEFVRDLMQRRVPARGPSGRVYRVPGARGGKQTGRSGSREIYVVLNSGKRVKAYRASAPGEPPAIRTGRLVGAIGVLPISMIRKRGGKYRTAIGANVNKLLTSGKRKNYAKVLEYGGGRVKPRPAFQLIFLHPEGKRRVQRGFNDGWK